MTIDFNNKSTNYGANITGQGWVISTGPADTSDWYNFSKSFDTTGTFKVKYWVEIDGVCRDSLEKPLEIYPLVKTNFTVGNACSNDSVLFTNTSTISKGTASVFSWDVNNGTIYKKDVFKAKYASPGAKNIELVMVSDKGCKSTLKKTVQVREINLKDIVSKDVCVNENQILKVNKTVTFDTISRYSWIVNSTVVSTDSTMSFKQASAGKYKIVLNVTTKNGCLGEVIDTVEVFGLPTAAYTIAPVCVNQDFQTVNTSSAPSTSVISSYQWFVNGTGIGSAMEPAFAASTAATYNFRLIVTSDKGCKDTTDLAVSANPLPRINFTVSDTCIGEISTLRDASTVSSGSLLGYIWRFADGTNANGQNTTKTFGTLGNHLVKHIVSTDKGCIDSMSKNVSMNPLPVLDISGTDLEGCMPFTPTFVNNSSVSIGSISTYTWFWGDGSSSTGITPTHSYVDQGNYNIKIRATTDKGCRDSMDLSGTVVVHPLPMADFSFTPEKPSILESTITITDLSSTDIVNWNWSMGDGTTYSDQNPIHNFQDTGTYKIVLIATNDKGCSDEASQVLFINPDLFIYIPTSFTPNGDRLNDRFGVSGVKQGIRNYSLAIYNRWGEKIFYSENVDDQWDGTYNGVDVPAGVYFYMMTFSDYKKTRWYYEKGDLSVIR
jgi:gliding motility-associated-like protein